MIPRPRNPDPVEPGWCVKTDHSDSFVGRHLSKEIRVGKRRERGEVAAWLLQGGNGPTWVTLLCAHMASATVEITLDDAEQLRDGLTWLLEQTGHETRRDA